MEKRVLGKEAKDVVLYCIKKVGGGKKLKNIACESNDHIKRIVKIREGVAFSRKRNKYEKLPHQALDDILNDPLIKVEDSVKECLGNFLKGNPESIEVEEIIKFLFTLYNDAVRALHVKSI